DQYGMGPGEGYPEDTQAHPPDQYGMGPGEIREPDTAGMPADTYGAPPGDIYGQWRAASQQEEIHGGWKLPVGRIIRTTIIMLMIGGAVTTAIFLLVPRIFPDQVDYSSSVSNLTFKYPSDWQSVSVNEVGSVGGLHFSDFSYFNEALLSDVISMENSYLLRSLSVPDISNVGFQSRRNDLKKAIINSVHNDMDPGTERPAIAFEDTNVHGNPAFTASFNYTKNRKNNQMNIAVIHNGTTEYYIYLTGFGDTDAREVFNQILESITFRG
ncbi:MAG: hypothetical protein JXA49_07580, partial [Actinobacteria bacterium]|nr:hypothetical protein [Actinomycetota bacterium]